MNIKQKELVLLPYPFTDQGGTKVRPALVISNDIFNKKSNDCILIPLTTVIKDEPYSILISQENLSSGKLLKLSRIRVDKIFTIDKSLIMMKMGAIDNKTFEKIKSEILKIF
jgi:mRNA interferase MazF